MLPPGVMLKLSSLGHSRGGYVWENCSYVCMCVFFVFQVRCSLSIMFAYHFELLIAKGTLGCQTGVRAIQ